MGLLQAVPGFTNDPNIEKFCPQLMRIFQEATTTTSPPHRLTKILAIQFLNYYKNLRPLVMNDPVRLGV